LLSLSESIGSLTETGLNFGDLVQTTTDPLTEGAGKLVIILAIIIELIIENRVTATACDPEQILHLPRGVIVLAGLASCVLFVAVVERLDLRLTCSWSIIGRQRLVGFSISTSTTIGVSISTSTTIGVAFEVTFVVLMAPRIITETTAKITNFRTAALIGVCPSAANKTEPVIAIAIVSVSPIGDILKIIENTRCIESEASAANSGGVFVTRVEIIY